MVDSKGPQVNWSRQTVLVTGAGGFIGSHLVERLVALGAHTRAFVRYNSTGSWGWLERSPVKDQIEVYAGDIRDVETLRAPVQGADIVFHLAALIGIPYSYDAPLSYVRTNVEGTANLLSAAHQAGARLVIHTSTSEVYGTPHYIPIDEDHPLQGQSPYSASKIGADKMAEAYNSAFRLPVVTIRPFNTYGPRQSSRAVIPTIVSQALTQPAINLGNLKATRDFTYVSDTIEGFIKAAQCPEAVGTVTNLGAGLEISIEALARMVLHHLGKEIPIISSQERVRPDHSEVERLCSDNRKAKRLLDWSPEYSLTDGLTETIQWIETHIETYRTSVYAK